MPIETRSDLVPKATLEGDTLSAAFASDVTVMNAPDAREVLTRLVRQEKPKRLVLDMSSVSYMDSSGLAVLVEVRRAMARDATVELRNLTDEVLGLMKIMNLHAVFKISQP
jgi:anti-sigma B factor antagonist